MSLKPGFITPPWPHERGDSIKASCLIERFEKEAIAGCGLYFEIYEYRVRKELREIVDELSAEDAETLRLAASHHGHDIDDEAMDSCAREYQNTLQEIRKERE